jgi:hypothetical protein
VDDADMQSSLPLGFVPSQLASQLCGTNAEAASQWLEQSAIKKGGYGYSFAAHLEGCLFELDPAGGINPQQVDPLTDTQNAWYLEHFGAMLAVNNKAHAWLPQLPRATAVEVHDILGN